MQDVKNDNGKLVCRVDTEHQVVEIVQKGVKTIIKFNPDGTMQINGGKTVA
ncbi:MAG: hypothetical protein RR444_00630 [Oscillospiraceae bacterium]